MEYLSFRWLWYFAIGVAKCSVFFIASIYSLIARWTCTYIYNLQNCSLFLSLALSLSPFFHSISFRFSVFSLISAYRSTCGSVFSEEDHFYFMNIYIFLILVIVSTFFSLRRCVMAEVFEMFTAVMLLRHCVFDCYCFHSAFRTAFSFINFFLILFQLIFTMFLHFNYNNETSSEILCIQLVS